jgi:predicted small metal-binding protein
MAYTLACKDLGEPTCPFVARGETKEEVLAKAAKHGKEVHGYTDKQLNDPKMIEQLKAKIKGA